MNYRRREFLKQSALLSMIGLGNRLFGKIEPGTLSVFENTSSTVFTLPELPYGYDALEPLIDKDTMILHHSKHHKTYVDNLNKALGELKISVSLEQILKTVSSYNASVRNNAGGHYNHSLFWTLMQKPETGKNNLSSGKLSERINSLFGSQENFQKTFSEKAVKVFGSGWCWLVVTADKELNICTTPNQDNPLMDLAEAKGRPVLALDVWEHAYYLKYQNRRAEYIQNWWNLVNWTRAEELYKEAMAL